MVRREQVLAGLLALVGAGLVYAIATVVFPFHTTNHDEAVYLQQAAMLLDGTLTLSPPVPDAFHPWFFVESGDEFYPKYSPVPAAMFAGGTLLGGYRLSLAGIAAANIALAYGIAAEVFDRHTGLLAALVLILSPLFLIDSAVFLPYAPTAAWNLLFGFAYLRADRTANHRWAAIAGGAIGIAFVSRPYTAVLFAMPFIVHALWTLRQRDQNAHFRQVITAALGLVGVGIALIYNALMTGSPVLFPYEAFAPADGIGFGRREILGYERTYTPALAIRANIRAIGLFLSQWMTAGLLGSALAAFGIGVAVSRMRDEIDPRQLLLLGLIVSIVIGNLYFWGTLNVLGSLDDPDDGLVQFLGPYYHFDLLLPMAAFAARGILELHGQFRRVAGRLPGERTPEIVLAGTVVGAIVLGGAATAVLADPIEENRAVTAELRTAYQPFEERDLSRALVFLPTPYGDWLNHPFQTLRNDPRYDGAVVYAIEEDPFAVRDAFPKRTVYRYVYRGAWAPYAGSTVAPRLQRVREVSGEQVTLVTTIEMPDEATGASIRLAGGDDVAYYTTNGTPDPLTLRLEVADGRAHLSGPVTTVGDADVAVGAADSIVVETFVDYRGASGLTYRIELPVETTSDRVRALTPLTEVCRNPEFCGGEAAYIPNETSPEIGIGAQLRTNSTADTTRTALRIERGGS